MNIEKIIHIITTFLMQMNNVNIPFYAFSLFSLHALLEEHLKLGPFYQDMNGKRSFVFLLNNSSSNQCLCDSIIQVPVSQISNI